jgi:DNA end-binding protein Ku
MAHAIWKGSLAFGLVNIPVNVYSGEERSSSLDFTLLDKKNMSPVGYKKVNKATGEEVPKERLVKGYEIDDDRYVVVEEADFKRAAAEKTQRVDIRAFIDVGEVDPSFFVKPYYLEPAAKADKAYALLREAMKRTGKAALATVVFRDREILCVVIPRDEMLLLEMIRYPAELKDTDELKLPAKVKLSEAELKMAERLIADMAAPFEPDEYHDQYREQLRKFIEAKAEGAVPAPAAPDKSAKAAPPEDIMKLLKASVAQAAKGGKPKTPGRFVH